MGYNFKMQGKDPQAQAIVRQRETNDKLLKESQDKKEEVTEVEVEEEAEIKETE